MARPAIPPSAPHTSATSVVRFGLFELDLHSRELRRRGVRVRLADQPFLILEMLVERPGEIVTREALRKRLWPDDTFVEFDLSLNSAVRKVREALDDSADQPTYVATVPRRGYRFLAPVERVGTDLETPAPAGAVGRLVRGRRLVVGIAGAAIAGLVLIAAGLWPTRDPPAAVPPIRTIAVLPLQNLTGEVGRDYFVDGMTDALITELARLNAVAVVSKTSSMQYKATTKRVPDIARELGVDALVEGTVGMSGESVHIRAQLVLAKDVHVWADEFDRRLEDVPSLHAEIAREVVSTILKKPIAAPPQQAEVVAPAAYDLYLKGVAAAGRRNLEGFRIAESYFEQAVDQAPDFARAHGALARTRQQFLYGSPWAPAEILPRAEDAARTALRLDPNQVEAHRALAVTRRVYGDYAGSEAEVKRLRDLDPASLDSLDEGLVGASAPRMAEALAAARRRQQRDPLEVNALLNLARTLRAAGRSDEAVAELRTALTLEPGRANVLFQLGATLFARGDFPAGIAEIEQAVARSTQRNSRYLAYLGYAYAMTGRREEAGHILEELLALRMRQYVSSFGIALVYDALGDKAASRTALARAAEEYALEFTQLDVYPAFDALVASPRYKEVLRWSASR